MNPSATGSASTRIDDVLFFGLFLRHTSQDGTPYLLRHSGSPSAIPCPTTGRQLRVATIEASAAAICPACASHGRGGFVSFEADLRMAYACPACNQLIWIAGL